MNRRAFLSRSMGLSAAVAGLGRRPAFGQQGSADATKWRAFEVTTRVEIVNANGAARAWVPLPLSPDTDYFKSLGHGSSGNTKATRIVRDERYGAGIFVAEWEPGEAAPVVEVINRFATRDRAVDFKPVDAREGRRVLARYTEATRLMPVDGIVQKTAREITRGQKTDLDKARAIYE